MCTVMKTIEINIFEQFYQQSFLKIAAQIAGKKIKKSPFSQKEKKLTKNSYLDTKIYFPEVKFFVRDVKSSAKNY